jgi:hypothetical protein
MVRGAEMRHQAHRVSPIAHDTNGLCVNGCTPKKYLKRLAIL